MDKEFQKITFLFKCLFKKQNKAKNGTQTLGIDYY